MLWYDVGMSIVTINLPKKDKERLDRLALQYGLSLQEFSKKILSELSSEFPEESFDDYMHPKRLKASYQRALRDWKTGRISQTL